MLRHAVSKTLSRSLQYGRAVRGRSYAAATSRQKRALNEKQLQGQKSTPQPTKQVTGGGGGKATPPPPAAITSTPPIGGGGDGGGNAMPLAIGVGLLAAGGAVLYYFNEQEEIPKETAVETAVETTPAKEEETPATTPAKEVKEEKLEPAAVVEEKAAEKPPTSIRAEDGSNRVIQIEPMNEGTRSAPAEAAAGEIHPEGGNRVTMESFQNGKQAASTTSTVSVRDSLKELQSSIEQETSEVTMRANEEVMRSFDASLFEGLDEMSPSQLKARVMQLATEMKERTRWEALRLKEFLAMKEKETADKYLDVLQKQRLEFEGILQRRILEQEHEMTTQTNAKLQEKDGAVKEMIDSAIQKLGDEHENEKQALTERKDQELKSQYEQMFSEKLEEFKQKAIDEMERKVQALEALNKKLKDLENALASSQNYQDSSLKAHRLSAAALALAEKMESNKGAGTELNAVKAVSGGDNAIAAALSSIPSSVSKGVPTLSELQARFDKVASKTRQAALVPAGQTGLEGQLAGMLLATLKFPPKPDDPPTEDNSGCAAEYILVQARQHVRVGELDKAVQQLDKLEGQAAFTMQGWKKDATDRVTIEQALKVIKMECALLNETMSKP